MARCIFQCIYLLFKQVIHYPPMSTQRSLIINHMWITSRKQIPWLSSWPNLVKDHLSRQTKMTLIALTSGTASKSPKQILNTEKLSVRCWNQLKHVGLSFRKYQLSDSENWNDIALCPTHRSGAIPYRMESVGIEERRKWTDVRRRNDWACTNVMGFVSRISTKERYDTCFCVDYRKFDVVQIGYSYCLPIMNKDSFSFEEAQFSFTPDANSGY